MDVLGGGHFTYSVLCQFDLGPVSNDLGFVNVSNVINDGCGPSAPSADVAEPIINNYAIAFFNWQLRGSTGSLKYLTQAAGEALTPGFKTPCVPGAADGLDGGNGCQTCTCDDGTCGAPDTGACADGTNCTCDPSINCCNLDGSKTCCVLQYNTNIYAGQSTCVPGQLCDPTAHVCEAVGFESDF